MIKYLKKLKDIKMNKIKKIFINKPMGLFLLISGFIYNIVLPFCWGNDPFDVDGTLSILCRYRPFYFWIWVITVGGAYLVNTFYAYEKYGDKNKFLRVLSVFTFAACCAIALTLDNDPHSWGPVRIIHWIATGLYILTVALSVSIFLIRNVKKYRGFNVLIVIILLLVLLIIFWLVVIGKSAMMELVPNALFQILLLFLNYVPVFKAKD